MSKALAASCAGSVVKVGAYPVTGTTILSLGKGSSQGITIIDEDKSYYVANTTPDTVTLINDLIEGLQKVVTLMQQVNMGLAGAGSTPYPGFATDAAAIIGGGPNSVVSKLGQLKENLK